MSDTEARTPEPGVGLQARVMRLWCGVAAHDWNDEALRTGLGCECDRCGYGRMWGADYADMDEDDDGSRSYTACTNIWFISRYALTHRRWAIFMLRRWFTRTLPMLWRAA